MRSFDPRDYAHIHHTRLTEVPHDGVLRYLTFFNRERLIIYSHHALADVLVTNCYAFQKPAFLADPMRIILGNGLLLSEGEEHRVQKKALLPAFSRQRINDMFPIFCDKARKSAVGISAALAVHNGYEIDIGNWASRYALDVIGLAGLGQDFGAIEDENNSLVETYRTVFGQSKVQRIIFFCRGLVPSMLLEALPSCTSFYIHPPSLSRHHHRKTCFGEYRNHAEGRYSINCY